MEQSLEWELDCLEAIINLWDDNPALFTEMLGILECSKDPFYAIALLGEDKVLPPAELFIVAHLCFCVKRIRYVQEAAGIFRWPGKAVPPGLELLEKLLAPGSQGQPSFYVSDAYSPPLAATRKLRKQKQKMWRQEMANEAAEVERVLGRRPGVSEEIAIRKTNYAHIEKARLMPELGETRETLTHVYFRLKATRNAVRLEREINRLKVREREQEEEVLLDLSARVTKHASDIEAAAQAIGELDFLICKAELARSMDATRPEIVACSNQQEPGQPCVSSLSPVSTPGPRLMLENACHTIILDEVKLRGGRYQPISIEVDSIVLVITGPNMGGKTVALATVGLCVAMAQWGLMVPCTLMRFGLYDFIHFQPQEEEAPGLSSFATEIVNLKGPLSRMGEKGLVLLDEVGRGTNPSQGLALYAALLLHYLENDTAGSTVIATTHYHGLAAMLSVPHWQVKGLVAESLDLGDAGQAWADGTDGIDWLYRHMDYTLQKVGPDTPTPQDALLVAKALGLSKDIIRKAQEFHGPGE